MSYASVVTRLCAPMRVARRRLDLVRADERGLSILRRPPGPAARRARGRPVWRVRCGRVLSADHAYTHAYRVALSATPASGFPSSHWPLLSESRESVPVHRTRDVGRVCPRLPSGDILPTACQWSDGHRSREHQEEPGAERGLSILARTQNENPGAPLPDLVHVISLYSDV